MESSQKENSRIWLSRNAQLTYYIPDYVFTEEEKNSKVIEKVQGMFNILIKEEDIKEHLTKWDYSITISV